MSKIIEKLLADAAKSDEERMEEQWYDAIEEHCLEIESSISVIKTKEIPEKELALKRP
jgi:hypothetical protein